MSANQSIVAQIEAWAGKSLPPEIKSKLEWQKIETAPKDGIEFWGKIGDDAIKMFWHPDFGAFVSSFRRMTMASGYTFGDGSREKDHSPTIRHPTHWMLPIPAPPASEDET